METFYLHSQSENLSPVLILYMETAVISGCNQQGAVSHWAKLLGITDRIDQAYKLRDGGMGDDSKASALTYILESAGLSVFERTMT